MDNIDKNSGGYVKCPKCGQDMKSDGRFCLHCGYVNHDNKENYFLEKYEKKSKGLFSLKKDKSGEVTASGYFATLNNPLEKSSKEVGYTIFKNVFRIILLVALIAGGYFGYNFITEKQKIYVKDANTIVDYVKNNVTTCGDRFYFKFVENELNEKYKLNVKSPYTKKSYSGYVLVTTENNKTVYHIAMTDGTFGITERDIKDVENYNVLPFFGLKMDEITSTEC